MAQVLPQSHAAPLMRPAGDGKDPSLQPSPVIDSFHFGGSSDSTTEGKGIARDPFQSTATPSNGAPSFAQRHTRKHMSLALPSFSFNPGAAQDNTDKNDSFSQQESPPQASPSRGRHRRIQSEFIGAQDATRGVPAAIDFGAVRPTPSSVEPRDESPVKPPSRGHRHRRSGAVSQDLNAPQPETRATVPVPNLPPTAIRPGAEYLRSANDTPTTSKSSSPVRVSFADNIEVIPRRSLPSLREQPSLPSTRAIHTSDGLRDESGDLWLSDGAPSEEPIEVTEPFDFHPNEDLDESSVTIVDEAPQDMQAAFSLPSDYEFSDEQFGEPGFETLSEGYDYDTAPFDYSARPDSAPDARSAGVDHSESVVDLDSALDLSESAPPLTSQELRVLRAKSFSAGRRSMHSGGLPPLLASPLHRRADSAPSLPMPSFDRPVMPRLDSTTASEKGFEMENVFEEDEEQAELEAAAESGSISNFSASRPHSKPGSAHGLPDIHEESTSPTAKSLASPSEKSVYVTPDSSPTTSSSGAVKANAWLTDTGTRASTSTITPDLLGKISQTHGRRFVEEPESMVSSPPATPGTSSGVGASSTCDDWNADGQSGPYSQASSFTDPQQLGLPKPTIDTSRVSSEGAPSLISSRGTIASGLRQFGSALPSPRTADASTIGEPPSSSGSGSLHSRWRKRSSIASLSRLMSGTASPRSHLSVEYSPRCQTSDGLQGDLTPSRAPSKRKKLGRLLKYFRPKDEGSDAPG